MATQESSGTLNHLFEMLTKIDNQKRVVIEAEENVKTAKAELAKLELEVAKPLEVYKLAFIPEAKEESSEAPRHTPAPKRKMDGESARTRRKPEDVASQAAAELTKNRATYVSEYPKGTNELTGLPNKTKGKSDTNKQIKTLMEKDEAAYEARNQNNDAAPAPEGEAESTTAARPTSKSKAKPDAQPA